MAFVPATNVIQAEMVCTWDTQICENVLHYQRGGGVTEQAMTDVGQYLATWWNGFIKPLVGITLSLTEIRLTDLTTQFAPGMSFTTGLPIVGTNGSATLPNNVSISMTKRTNYRGRSYRGRLYHMGLMEAQVGDNRVAASTVTQLIAAYNGLVSINADGVPSPLVVVSKYQGGLPRAGALMTPVLSFATDGIIDSQRRRLPRRGT